jgi:hypothetical protein
MSYTALPERPTPSPRRQCYLLAFGAASIGAILGCGAFDETENAESNALAEITDLTCSLKTDLGVYSTPALSRPGYLQSITDPVFGTKITRISGNVGSAIPNIAGTWGNIVRHHYSKDQPWNADQTLIYLDTNSGNPPDLFLDGNSYQPLFSHTRPYQSDVRWHDTNPDVMIYVAANVFGYWNVRTNTKTVVRTFSGYSGFTFGGFEGNSSEDNTKIMIDGNASNGDHVAFAYDYVNNVKYPDISEADVGIAFGGGTISAKGTYIVLGDEAETTVVTDLQGNIVHTWPGGRPSHFDQAIDANGDEVGVGVSKQSPDAGRVIKRRLSDGQVTTLTQGGWASHTSTRNLKLHGWSVSDYTENSTAWNPYIAEIDLISLSGSRVYRLAHHHNVSDGPDYESETHAVASRDGLRVMFASSWGQSSFRPVATYVVDLRGKCTYAGSGSGSGSGSPELLANPGFEAGLTSWTSWANSSAVTSPVYAGARSLRVGLNDGGVYQDVTAKLSPGVTYKLSYVAQLGSSSQYAEIGIEFFDGNGNVIYDRHAVPASTSWTRQSFTFTAPAASTTALVYVWRPTGTRYIYVDDLSLTR